MKKIHLLIIAPLMLLLVLAYTQALPVNPAEKYALRSTSVTEPATKSIKASADTGKPAASLLRYAMSLMGTPYFYTGISPETGFDCSGFITHVFGTESIKVPHSSALQAKEGTAVSRSEARAGDIIIFTGTNRHVRKPGHAGIILSAPGDTISFIHSSSNGGVKISKVEGTGYNDRFLEIRRIL